MPPPPIAIGLGSNVGPGPRLFNEALRRLARAGVHTVARSRLYWTRPWGLTDQTAFLNAAIAVRTRLRPPVLLELCLRIERGLGRRRIVHWGPRILDLDLLLYGACRWDAPGLRLPHPYIAERDFVLAPLIDLGLPAPAELAPGGWRAALNALPERQRTLIHAEPWGNA